MRTVDIIKAIASSGGIAGWVVWRDYPFVWSGIIASAQLLDAVKHVFPFARLHKAASDLTVALEFLFIDSQLEWERIYAGKLTNEGIMVSRRKLQKLQLEAEQKFFPEGFEPPPKLIALANTESRTYMRSIDFDAGGHEQK